VIADVVPGPRVAVCIEGSRSYGIGLTRALAAAGLLVLECEQPSRRQRRGKGKSDPIDAHLAVLTALRLDASRLLVPRADGDREALRILLVARQEITEACTAQSGRLRALLLAGDDTDRRAARTTVSVRRPRRHQPAPGQQRNDRPAPPQPQRGPGAEPRHPRHRAGPDAQLSSDPRLCRPAYRRGKDSTGDPPLPQALYSPP
jgi:hypothetical protein